MSGTGVLPVDGSSQSLRLEQIVASRQLIEAELRRRAEVAAQAPRSVSPADRRRSPRPQNRASSPKFARNCIGCTSRNELSPLDSSSHSMERSFRPSETYNIPHSNPHSPLQGTPSPSPSRSVKASRVLRRRKLDETTSAQLRQVESASRRQALTAESLARRQIVLTYAFNALRLQRRVTAGEERVTRLKLAQLHRTYRRRAAAADVHALLRRVVGGRMEIDDEEADTRCTILDAAHTSRQTALWNLWSRRVGETERAEASLRRVYADEERDAWRVLTTIAEEAFRQAHAAWWSREERLAMAAGEAHQRAALYTSEAKGCRVLETVAVKLAMRAAELAEEASAAEDIKRRVDALRAEMATLEQREGALREMIEDTQSRAAAQLAEWVDRGPCSDPQEWDAALLTLVTAPGGVGGGEVLREPNRGLSARSPLHAPLQAARMPLPPSSTASACSVTGRVPDGDLRDLLDHEAYLRGIIAKHHGSVLDRLLLRASAPLREAAAASRQPSPPRRRTSTWQSDPLSADPFGAPFPSHPAQSVDPASHPLRSLLSGEAVARQAIKRLHSGLLHTIAKQFGAPLVASMHRSPGRANRSGGPTDRLALSYKEAVEEDEVSVVLAAEAAARASLEEGWAAVCAGFRKAAATAQRMHTLSASPSRSGYRGVSLPWGVEEGTTLRSSGHHSHSPRTDRWNPATALSLTSTSIRPPSSSRRSAQHPDRGGMVSRGPPTLQATRFQQSVDRAAFADHPRHRYVDPNRSTTHSPPPESQPFGAAMPLSSPRQADSARLIAAPTPRDTSRGGGRTTGHTRAPVRPTPSSSGDSVGSPLSHGSAAPPVIQSHDLSSGSAGQAQEGVEGTRARTSSSRTQPTSSAVGSRGPSPAIRRGPRHSSGTGSFARSSRSSA